MKDFAIVAEPGLVAAAPLKHGHWLAHQVGSNTNSFATDPYIIDSIALSVSIAIFDAGWPVSGASLVLSPHQGGAWLGE